MKRKYAGVLAMLCGIVTLGAALLTTQQAGALYNLTFLAYLLFAIGLVLVVSGQRKRQ